MNANPRGGWREQEKMVRLAWLALGVVVVVLAGRRLRGLVLDFTEPRVPAACLTKPEYASFARVNLLVDLEPPTLASLDWEEKELTLLIFPKKTIVDVLPAGSPGGFCLEPTVARRLTLLSGLPVDGYLLLSRDAGALGEGEILRLRSLRWFFNPVKVIRVMLRLKTDFSFKQIYHFWLWLRGVHPAGISRLDFRKGRYYNQEKGEWHEEAADMVISETIFDPKIRAEKARIMVLNGSEVQGAASQFGRLVTNLGGQLAAVRNLDQSDCRLLSMGCPNNILEETALITTPALRSSLTARRLGSVVKARVYVRERLPAQADIVWIIGRDMTDRLPLFRKAE
jgi:hypothetical protein